MVRPLKEPRSIGQALTYEQKVRLLHAADSKPEWQNARLAMALALCTTMRGVEIKNLCWAGRRFAPALLHGPAQQDGR